jgi:hypothetical protein
MLADWYRSELISIVAAIFVLWRTGVLTAGSKFEPHSPTHSLTHYCMLMVQVFFHVRAHRSCQWMPGLKIGTGRIQ